MEKPIAPAPFDVHALLPQVYSDLKQLAHRQRLRLRPGDTLSTTCLVHEAYERLAPHAQDRIQSREHLMAYCARAMRQILIDAARARSADKRGSGQTHYELAEHDLIDGNDPDALLAMDQALNQLALHDERLVRLIELRLFAGLEPAEIAPLLDVTLRTVQRDWQRAKAWLGATLQP